MSASQTSIEPIVTTADVLTSNDGSTATDEVREHHFRDELPSVVYTPESPLRHPVSVLGSMARELTDVNNIFVEYHSFYDRPQRLSTLFSVLEKAGFRLHARPDLPALQPFMDRPIINKKDFRLNVFGIKCNKSIRVAKIAK